LKAQKTGSMKSIFNHGERSRFMTDFPRLPSDDPTK